MSKNRVIVEAVLAGRSHAAVAEQYGISKVWVGKLMARWRTGGLDSIKWRCRYLIRTTTQPRAEFSNRDCPRLIPRPVKL